MAQTLIQRRKASLLAHRFIDTETAVKELRTNQVHSAIAETQMIVGPGQFTNLQIWNDFNADSVNVKFDDWIYMNFYFECVMNNASGAGIHHTAEAQMFNNTSSAVFAGSTMTTTVFSSHNDPGSTVTVLRSGLLTKPAQIGTFGFNLEIGIDVSGSPNSFVNVYVPRLIIRYEGA